MAIGAGLFAPWGAGSQGLRLARTVPLGRLDQPPEQGVGFAGPGEEFGVVLAGCGEGMAPQFDQFHQPTIGRTAAHYIARLYEC